MIKALKNRSTMNIDKTLNLTPAEIKKGDEAFSEWHWGIQPVRVADWNDPDYPKILIECGRLIRIHVRTPHQAFPDRDQHPRRKRDTMIEFSRKASQRCHIAFDPEHPNGRLYLLIEPGARRALARQLFEENQLDPMPLQQAARLTSGRHSTQTDYPDVEVKPVGIMSAVVYFTHKKDDGPSFYIHEMGELTRQYPFLCADAQGRLWVAGGNYTSPTAGITD
jgi:hypothetical protein